MNELFQRTSVLITIVVCGTMIIVGALTGVVVLSFTGHGTEAVVALTATLVVPLLGALWGKITAVQHQTNSTNETLLRAVMSSPALPAAIQEANRASQDPPSRPARYAPQAGPVYTYDATYADLPQPDTAQMGSGGPAGPHP